MYFLSVSYKRGRGVPKNNVLAHMWANLAAARGQPEAPELRDQIAKAMTSEQIIEAQRLARHWKPKNKTHK